MSNAVSRLSYMKLEDSELMFFYLNDKKQNVETASAEVFDRFISEAVEEIRNVDRSKWPIFQRWRIINACLPEEVLILEKQPDGSLLLRLPEVGSSEPEEKASTSTQEDTGIYAAFGPLSKASQDAFSERARQQREDEHPLAPVVPSGGRGYPDLEEGE